MCLLSQGPQVVFYALLMLFLYVILCPPEIELQFTS